MNEWIFPAVLYTMWYTHTFIYGNYSLYNACILLKVINEGICLSFHCSPLHRATGHIMSSLFYPLITFLLLALFISYWAVTAVYPLTPNQWGVFVSLWSASAAGFDVELSGFSISISIDQVQLACQHEMLAIILSNSLNPSEWNKRV